MFFAAPFSITKKYRKIRNLVERRLYFVSNFRVLNTSENSISAAVDGETIRSENQRLRQNNRIRAVKGKLSLNKEDKLKFDEIQINQPITNYNHVNESGRNASGANLWKKLHLWRECLIWHPINLTIMPRSLCCIDRGTCWILEILIKNLRFLNYGDNTDFQRVRKFVLETEKNSPVGAMCCGRM